MIQKQLGLAMIVAAAMAFPAAGMAKGLENSYAELGYYAIDSDAADADGFKALLSFGAHDYVNLRASFANVNVDDANQKIDEFTVGFGGHYEVIENVDVVAGVVYSVVEGNGDAKADAEGTIADFGFRALLMKKLELNAAYVSQQIGNDTTEAYTVGAVFKMTKKLAASVNYKDVDDSANESNLFVGVRLNF